jgi:hypothetical protein
MKRLCPQKRKKIMPFAVYRPTGFLLKKNRRTSRKAPGSLMKLFPYTCSTN